MENLASPYSGLDVESNQLPLPKFCAFADRVHELRTMQNPMDLVNLPITKSTENFIKARCEHRNPIYVRCVLALLGLPTPNKIAIFRLISKPIVSPPLETDPVDSQDISTSIEQFNLAVTTSIMENSPPLISGHIPDEVLTSWNHLSPKPLKVSLREPNTDDCFFVGSAVGPDNKEILDVLNGNYADVINGTATFDSLKFTKTCKKCRVEHFRLKFDLVRYTKENPKPGYIGSANLVDIFQFENSSVTSDPIRVYSHSTQLPSRLPDIIVEGIYPHYGPPNTRVAIVGKNFGNNARVSFAGQSVDVTSHSVTVLLCTVPELPAGIIEISISNNSQPSIHFFTVT